jgi:hypothetical protein
MRNKKKLAALATGALVLGSAGVAYAYWTTTGTGTGAGTTSAGVVDMVGFDQDALNPMYPGDSSQPLSVTVSNDSTESAYIAVVKAYITTNKAGCTGADFLLDGVAAPSTAAAAAELAWTAQDLGAGLADDATGTIQFNNTGGNQDACKSAAVTIHYLAS